jgi:hypothetical protein
LVERRRLEETRTGAADWKKWGPYLSERQWGTVREDYSETGNAWDYFSHDQSRSRAYRWGEDGLAGYSDNRQLLCFSLALWNGVDPILKERLFGLTNSEGNHGEDCKEYYFYLDSTPTHSWMKYLYKYPQRAFPYEDLVKRNRLRSKHEPEYELLDTGVFDDNRYFDVFVTFAKSGVNDTFIEITAANRGPEEAEIHLLPTLCFRNTWSWRSGLDKPVIRSEQGSMVASHPELGTMHFYAEGAPELLFTENETNRERVFGIPNPQPFVKDAFHRYLIAGDRGAVNPALTGTKAAFAYLVRVPAGESRSIRLRLTGDLVADPMSGFEEVTQARRAEADRFYAPLCRNCNEDEGRVIRQALAGMMWTKQYYYFDLERWLEERGADPISGRPDKAPRNRDWYHMVNQDIISMPDKWEYPWYAAWDLAFHTIALAMVDLDFAKHQLDLMLRENYLHPNGQMPAYEWNFGDVNPPVHAWAVFNMLTQEQATRDQVDWEYYEHAFAKLLINFTWWVNRKDRTGRNVFEGGFLGLDNIGVFDRSAPIPGGGYLEQADGTAWMAFYSTFMLQLAVELAAYKPMYQDMACKFYEHFIWIASAMDRIGEHHDELWDEEDGFFYDVLRLPSGYAQRLKVRSLVGLMSLCATAIFQGSQIRNLPRLIERIQWFNHERPNLLVNINNPEQPGPNGGYLLSVLNERKIRRIVARLLDETEFLSDYGIRSLSKAHLENPYIFVLGREVHRVDYEPAESSTGMFGGNSNWRGPVWMPMNMLLVRALLVMGTYYRDTLKVELPTGSANEVTLGEAALELSKRLSRIFVRGPEGKRAVYGGSEKFQNDPHWRDLILFYEYFHGDNGAGIGASHQTGWTGVVARLIQFGATITPQDLAEGYFKSVMVFQPPEADEAE